MPGVTVVRDGDFLGVVAPTERAATAPRRRSGVVADGRPASRPPRRFFDYLKKNPEREGGRGNAPFTPAM